MVGNTSVAEIVEMTLGNADEQDENDEEVVAFASKQS